MKKQICFLMLWLFSSALLLAQGKASFMEGYAIRNNIDTIKCKVLYEFEHPHVGNKVTLEIEGDQISFEAGSVITGFGIYNDSLSHHYGFVTTNEMVGNRMVERVVYLKKLVAGPISLFENSFTTYSTKRKSFDSPIDKPISTTSQSTTTYYISKTDPDKPILAKAVTIAPYRKKDLQKYMHDNEALYENALKDMTIKEMIQVIEAYNLWHLSNKK